jgi:hypothetical protein
MAFLEDDLGNKSMMRKIVWMLAIVIVIWMLAELTANIWLAVYGKPYEIHVSFILAALGIVLGGKVTQKGVEMFQKGKDKDLG